MSKDEIEANFKFAIEQIRNSEAKNGGPTNDEKSKFYGLYKQATIGPCNIPQPWAINVVERAKWNAWNSLGKMSKETAMVKYCNLYMEIDQKYNKKQE